jgi:uridine kinase
MGIKKVHQPSLCYELEGRIRKCLRDRIDSLLIIGITGMPCVGKGTLIDVLAKHILREYPALRVARVCTREFLSREAERLGIVDSRSELQKLALGEEVKGILSGGPPGNLSFEALTCILKEVDSGAHVVFYDAVHWLSDLGVLSLFPRRILVHVRAHPDRRYILSNIKDEEEEGVSKTKKEFYDEEGFTTEALVLAIGAFAQVNILNAGSLEDFHAQIHFAFKHMREEFESVLENRATTRPLYL